MTRLSRAIASNIGKECERMWRCKQSIDPWDLGVSLVYTPVGKGASGRTCAHTLGCEQMVDIFTERNLQFSSMSFLSWGLMWSELTCLRTTSAHRWRLSIMAHGWERSTTIITIVWPTVSFLRTNGSSWLCHTTPSKTQTPIRSRKSWGGRKVVGEGGRRKKGREREREEGGRNRGKQESITPTHSHHRQLVELQLH